MEEKLKEIILEHENNLEKYTQERNSRNEKIMFMSEHKFEHELNHLKTQKEATTDIFYDYQSVITELKELLNAWNS